MAEITKWIRTLFACVGSGIGECKHTHIHTQICITGILYVSAHKHTRGVVNICLEQVPVDLTNRDRVFSGPVRPAWVGLLLLILTQQHTHTQHNTSWQRGKSMKEEYKDQCCSRDWSWPQDHFLKVLVLSWTTYYLTLSQSHTKRTHNIIPRTNKTTTVGPCKKVLNKDG